MATKLQQIFQTSARQVRQNLFAMKDYPRFTKPMTLSFMDRIIRDTSSTSMHPRPLTTASVLIAVIAARASTANILGRYKTCPFSVSVLSFILKYASSSATIRTVAGRLLPSSLATKCSAIGGAPADARGWWPVRDYWCLQVLPAGCLDTWAYTSVPLPSCVISTGCIPLHTKMSER